MPDDAISPDHLERLQPHEMHASDVVDALATHPRSGLSSHAAHERLRHYGPNALAEAPRQPAWLRFILQFRDIQVYLLLAVQILWINLVTDGVHHHRSLPALQCA